MKSWTRLGKSGLLLLALFAAPMTTIWTPGAFAAEPVAAAQQAAAVNINSATAEQLADALSGVGPAKAQAIVAYREANGPFSDKSQLLLVKGIGEAILKQNEDRIAL